MEVVDRKLRRRYLEAREMLEHLRPTASGVHVSKKSPDAADTARGTTHGGTREQHHRS